MIQALLILIVMLSASMAQAATYYIDDAGSNANDGTTTGTPWLTWAYAFSHSACGDTLIVLDGTYTSSNGAFSLTKVCTAETVYTVIAANERASHINGNGAFIPLMVQNSAYIVVSGLRVNSADLAPSLGGHDAGVMNIYNSTHVTIKRSICSHPNRYRNAGHCLQSVNSTFVVFEENEIYNFHRHGTFLGSNTHNSVARRNYCNPRNYPDLSGSEVENSTPPTGDDCVIVYPGNNNIIENNIAEGAQLKCFALEAISTSIGNKFFGNICKGADYGVALDARNNAPSITYMPRDTLIEHMAVIDTMTAFRFEGNKNTICRFCSAIGPGATGFEMTSISCCPGDGQRSGYIYNSLVTGLSDTSTRNGLSGVGVYITSLVQTWSYENSTSYNNSTNYNPASHANYNTPDTPLTQDPQMGTCYLWPPDGSNAQSGGYGATILYRTVNGVLTTEPLWDLNTGEFPHGAIVAGVNDIDGSSPYNVHERLHVNTGGCSFPASFGGGGTPDDPSTYETSTGSTSTMHDHTIGAGRDGLLVCVSLWKTGGTVGSVSAVSSGGEALTFVTGTTSPGTFRRTELWQRLAPTSGTRSITASTTGAVDGVITTSMEIDNVLSWNTAAVASGNGTHMAITVPVASDEKIYDCISTGKAYELSVGPDQQLHVQTDHATQALRQATGSQPGSAGGIIEYFNSLDTDYALVAVSASPNVSPGGATGTRTISKYLIECMRGSEAEACDLSSTNTAGIIAPTGSARIRAEISGGIDITLSSGMHWYCRKNADSYARVLDTFGSNVFRFSGNISDETLPGSNAATTQQLSSGNFVTGRVSQDQNTVIAIPAMTATQKTEMVGIFDFQASAGDTINCRPHLDNGSSLDAYTVTPTLTVVAPYANGGF